MEISCELLCYVLFKKVAIEPTQRYRAVLVVMDLCAVSYTHLTLPTRSTV